MEGRAFRNWGSFIVFIHGNIQSSTYEIKGSHSQFNTTLKMAVVVTLRVCWWVEDGVQLSMQKKWDTLDKNHCIITVIILGGGGLD